MVEEIDEESNLGVGGEYDGDDINYSKSKSGVGVCAGVSTSNSGVLKGPTID